MLMPVSIQVSDSLAARLEGYRRERILSSGISWLSLCIKAEAFVAGAQYNSLSGDFFEHKVLSNDIVLPDDGIVDDNHAQMRRLGKDMAGQLKIRH